MPISNFIPTIWSGRLLANLNDAHVYSSLFNRDWEGEIKSVGDSVRIHTVGRITVAAYNPASTTVSYEDPDGNTVVLTIDQRNYFAFRLDDLDKVQQKPKLMDEFMREAAWGLSDTADVDLAALLWSNIATANTLTAQTSVGTGAGDADAYELLIDLGVKLDENNVPVNGRWVVVPPWYRGLLVKDGRITSFGTEANRRAYAAGPNGLVGEVAGFRLHVSNNVPTSGSAHRLIAGYPGAAAYAEQILMDEPIRLETKFSTGMRGEHVYGRKVLDSNRIAGIEVTQAT